MSSRAIVVRHQAGKPNKQSWSMGVGSGSPGESRGSRGRPRPALRLATTAATRAGGHTRLSPPGQAGALLAEHTGGRGQGRTAPLAGGGAGLRRGVWRRPRGVAGSLARRLGGPGRRRAGGPDRRSLPLSGTDRVPARTGGVVLRPLAPDRPADGQGREAARGGRLRRVGKREVVAAARGPARRPVGHRPGSQLPWKPVGTRTGRCTSATGRADRSAASRIAR